MVAEGTHLQAVEAVAMVVVVVELASLGFLIAQNTEVCPLVIVLSLV